MPRKPNPLLDGQQTKTIVVRLSIETYRQIVDLATQERRSIQSAVVLLLERALAPEMKATVDEADNARGYASGNNKK